jgi:hypothetical protein
MDQIAWAPSHGLAGEAHLALVYQLRFSPKLLLLRTHEARAVVDLPAHSQETWFFNRASYLQCQTTNRTATLQLLNVLFIAVAACHFFEALCKASSVAARCFDLGKLSGQLAFQAAMTISGTRGSASTSCAAEEEAANCCSARTLSSERKSLSHFFFRWAGVPFLTRPLAR